MFDKIIRENHFKTLCVIAIYIFIFIVIGLLVAVIFFAIVGKGIYNRKHQKGGCSCGGNCGACGGCGVQVTKSQP